MSASEGVRRFTRVTLDALGRIGWHVGRQCEVSPIVVGQSAFESDLAHRFLNEFGGLTLSPPDGFVLDPTAAIEACWTIEPETDADLIQEVLGERSAVIGASADMIMLFMTESGAVRGIDIDWTYASELGTSGDDFVEGVLGEKRRPLMGHPIRLNT